MTDARDADLRDRVSRHASKLTPQQRVIAEFLLDNLREIPFLSVPELADRAGASEATVVRFCQRLGYTGYADMKMAYVDSMREDIKANHSAGADVAISDIDRDVLAAVAKLEQHNIDRTLDSIDRRDFSDVATTLFRADHVFTFGLGISAYLADFATYLFTEHGLRSSRLATRFTSPREQLVVLRPTDLVVCFSFPPYSGQTLEVLEECADKGIPTIAITDRETSPSAALASDSLIVSSHGMTLTNATASTQVLLHALVVEIASRHRGETVDALSRINRILREQSNVIDDSH